MIRDYSSDNVHKTARESLANTRTDLDFFSQFERGLTEVPQKDGKWREEKGKDNQLLRVITAMHPLS